MSNNNNGKNVDMHLIEGTMNEVMCTIENRTIIAYKIPRSKLDVYEQMEGQIFEEFREYFSQSGIYLFFGQEEYSETEMKDIVYIGRTKDGYIREKQHRRDNDKKIFTDMIFLTKKPGEILDTTAQQYLENSFYKLATQIGRYIIDNECEPECGPIPAKSIISFNEFIEDAKIAISVLGYKIFEPRKPVIFNKLVKEETIIKTDNSLENKISPDAEFHIKKNKTIIATGMLTNDGFIVLKGSEIVKEEMDSCREHTKKHREKIKKENKIDTNGKLTEDVLFKTPSGAATFILGGNSNGWITWITSDGTSLSKATGV